MLICKENKAMKVTLFAAAFLTILSTASLAQNAATAESVNYTSAQVRVLVHNARTPAEYKALRDYYAHLADVDSLKASDEKREWERRAANPVAYARKYPSPVDSAHYLYDSYSASAKAAANEAARYGKLAASVKEND
jgi:hypothetical protein